MMNGNRQHTALDVADVKLQEMKDASEQRWLTIDSICSNLLEMLIPVDDSLPMPMTLAIKFLGEYSSVMKALVVCLFPATV